MKMYVFHRSGPNDVLDDINRRMTVSDMDSLVFVVDLGRTVGYPIDPLVDESLGSGRYVVAEVWRSRTSDDSIDYVDLEFEVNVFGLALLSTERHFELAHSAELWESSCFVKEHDIETVMMNLDMLGIRYRIVKAIAFE